MPFWPKTRNENVCKCDRRRKTRCARPRAQQIFRISDPAAKCSFYGRKGDSGVLLGTQVALVIQPFLACPALVVIPVWRGVGRRAVLLRRIGPDGWIARAAGGALVALRMARGAPQCGMSHDGRLLKKGHCPERGRS